MRGSVIGHRSSALAVVLALALSAGASAQVLPPPPPGPAPPPPAEAPPNPDHITIVAIFKTINFGERAFVSGRFRRQENPEAEAVGYQGKTLTLEEAPHPFAAFTAIGSTVTDREGYYAFSAKPGLNSRYRVVSADPAVQSDAKLIRVRLRVQVEASRDRVKKGRSVELSGTVTPAHEGNRVEIQRRTKSGRWQTVSRTRLEGSEYKRKVKLRSDGVFRVRVLGDADHLPGVSKQVFVEVASGD
jgi:hypothetical protein